MRSRSRRKGQNLGEDGGEVLDDDGEVDLKYMLVAALRMRVAAGGSGPGP